jgi:ABC-type uncharacterized transport system substrate-binding protein
MIAEIREFVVVGGLASYGASRADLWRRAATYVVKILHGDNLATCRSNSQHDSSLSSV